MATNLEKLVRLPAVRHVAECCIDKYAPTIPTKEPVTLDRLTFDCLVLCALVGLDAAQDYIIKLSNSQKDSL